MEVEGEIYTRVQTFPTFHLLEGTSEIGYGYLLGAAYEVPEIALRVALTYHSALEVDFDDASETPFNAISGVADPEDTADFSVEFPESINLDFQTGVAENTLVFGSIHYEYWDGFNLSTDVGSYVNFTSDSTTYRLGVGRQLNENWAGSIAYTHRTKGTIPSDTALSPTTGLNALTVAAQYEMDAMTISGSFTYGIPGDQEVRSVPNNIDFDNNEVIGLGLRVGFRF
jgi:long-subunit fatty acid transport protein